MIWEPGVKKDCSGIQYLDGVPLAAPKQTYFHKGINLEAFDASQRFSPGSQVLPAALSAADLLQDQPLPVCRLNGQARRRRQVWLDEA